MAHYGIGPLTAVVILAELGDARRFSSAREASKETLALVEQIAQERASGEAPCPGCTAAPRGDARPG